jgi:hypothetical protein
LLTDGELGFLWLGFSGRAQRRYMAAEEGSMESG